MKRKYYIPVILIAVIVALRSYTKRGWFGLVNTDGNNFIYDIVPSIMAQ
jgi:hypothetical protein